MEITGTYKLNMSQQQVWDAMMEPLVLTQCIPACEQIDKKSDDQFYASVKVKFGILPIRFKVNVALSQLVMPKSYSMTAQGESGLVDGAKALGTVKFEKMDSNITKVHFIGNVLPGSKLLELGEPLVQKTASKWFNRFFERFEKVVQG